jgi:hypothetical protein
MVSSGFRGRSLAPCCVALVVGTAIGCGRSQADVGPYGGGAENSGAAAGHPGVGGSNPGVGGGTASPKGGNGGSAGAAASAGGAGPTAGSAGTAGVPPDACPSPSPPAATLQRLEHFEYENTIYSLFPDVARPGFELPAEVTGNEDTFISLSPSLIEAYHGVAHDYAVSVTEDANALSALLGCDPADAETCRGAFLASFLARAFRRPATSDELDDFEQVFFAGETLGGDFASGVRAVLEVALQSPEFLYRVEFGEAAEDRDGGWARPTSYEMASRLSYAYSGAPPDAELLEAAARDELRSEDQLAIQAARLLGDPKARKLVSYFFEKLRLHPSAFPNVDSTRFPRFTARIPPLLWQETELFLNDVVFDGPGDVATLLTAPYSFMNEELASFYGLTGVSGDEFRRVPLDASRGGGLLVQGSFLAAYPRVVPRGIRILTSLLCEDVPQPPPDIPTPLPAPSPGPQTTRERLAEHSADPACAGCHHLIDPIGFAFGHFDENGVYMELENGLVIDTSGELVLSDVPGFFADLPGLLDKLTESPQVKRCLATKWMTFALNRELTPEDACSRQRVETAFIESGGQLPALFLALASTDAFRYRQATEVAP